MTRRATSIRSPGHVVASYPIRPIGWARHPQEGAATLIITLILFLMIALALLYANRTLLTDSHTARYQTASSQAFEAAEAGVEWMTAMLNDPHHVDDVCQPTSAPSATDLRHRLLTFQAASGFVVARTWPDGSVDRPLQVACIRGVDRWSCSCPSGSAPRPSPVVGPGSQASFLVSLSGGSRKGTIQLTSIGCNNGSAACLSNSSVAVEGITEVQTLLALLPALFEQPVSALITRSDIISPTASIGLSNTDVVSGGMTVDAGGSFVVPFARLTTAAGAAASLSVVEGDLSLRALTPDALFARHFGMDKSTWRQRPGVTRIACATACNQSVEAALSAGSQMIWIDGDFEMNSSATWGSSDQPVVVVATGTITLRGTSRLFGALYGNGVVWNDATPGSASLRGVLISEAGYGGDGSPDLIYDAAVLRVLNNSTGTFVRVPGSWRDF